MTVDEHVAMIEAAHAAIESLQVEVEVAFPPCSIASLRTAAARSVLAGSADSATSAIEAFLDDARAVLQLMRT